ncbi:divisome protein SepX/GlpR [Corynebacterium minutissimum]
MMTTVPIILVIVVWLFILAPWLLRSQRPMSHTGEAFEETRVLFEGDSGSVLGRRKPRLGKDDVRPSSYSSADDADADYELVIADDPAADSSRSAESSRREAEDADTVAATIDGEVVEAATEFEDGIDSDAGTDGAENAQAVPASAAQADAKADLEVEDDDVDDDDVIVDEERAEDAEGVENATGRTDASAAEVFTVPANASVAEDAYEHDETYTSPVDLLYPGAIDAPEHSDLADGANAAAGSNGSEEAGESDAAESRVALPVSETITADADADKRTTSDSDTELSAEELAFAQRRLGRGGWDPVKEKEASATRYQRRQRTLIGLAIAVVATVCLGIVVGGWTWWFAGVTGAITTIYLVALRSQVRREQELLRRRVYHLRRARLGVRNADNPAESLPPNLRRPGALVLEIDDESPDFDFLPVYDEDDSDGGFDGPHSSPRQRRDDLAARRVG